MRTLFLVLTLALAACTQPIGPDPTEFLPAPGQGAEGIAEEGSSQEAGDEDRNQSPEDAGADGEEGQSKSLAVTLEVECNGNMIAGETVDSLFALAEVTDSEDIYSTYDRIDGIASSFEACQDPWGLFPTTYRHITARIIQAIENGEIEDGAWGRRIVVDFAGRYLANLRAVLSNTEPSYAWEQYYYLADRNDVSRTRAVVVAMVAHLTLDLPTPSSL